MSTIHPAAVEHRRRRFLRPDWERWARPDWERYVRPAYHDAMRQEFAANRAAFETPLARKLREEREAFEHAQQAARDAERAWEAECAERKFRADSAWERFKLALVRGEFALRSKAGFNPDQTRAGGQCGWRAVRAGA